MLSLLGGLPSSVCQGLLDDESPFVLEGRTNRTIEEATLSEGWAFLFWNYWGLEFAVLSLLGVFKVSKEGLEDPDSKKYGSHIRALALPYVEVGAMETQHGSGLHAGSTEIVHLTFDAELALPVTRRLCVWCRYFH